MFYTYAHTKHDGTIFYIGKGTVRRLKARTNRNKHWKRTVAKHGLNVVVLGEFENEQDAFKEEKELIAHFKKFGNLVNYTDGGEGQSGYVHTKETKKKLSSAFIGGKNHKAVKIKFQGIVFDCMKNLAKFQNKNYTTVVLHARTNPSKYGYEVL